MIRAYFEAAPENYIDSTVFKVKIIDQCDSATVTQPIVEDLVYTITEPALTYSMVPLFTVSPDYCNKMLQVNTVEVIASYIKFNHESQTFTFPQLTDSLELSGPDEKTYPI